MRSFMGWTALAIAVAVGYGYSFHTSQTIHGSGTTKAESRDVEDFDGIVVGSAMKATVTVGPKTSLKIEADDNLLPLIETPIKDGHLVVQFKDGASVETKNPILLTVTTPRLSYIEGSGASVVVATASKSEKFEISSSGASKVDASGVDSGDVSVSASGASRLKLIGSGKAIKIELSGASRLDATGFSTDTVHIDASGASSAQVQASGSVAGELSGASKLEVAGSPSKRSVETSGVSHVSYK